ncbi:MAG: hypothetical protein OHK0029_04430 [Armatimonadaceae bacterium]
MAITPVHALVYGEAGRFAAWPANNGVWSWDGGSEVLVGFVTGTFTNRERPHNVLPPYRHHFARTTDGGQSWSVETPESFPKEGAPLQPRTDPLDFTSPTLALRFIGTYYHGSSEPRGGFAVSQDRGKTWQGPFALSGLDREPELTDAVLTTRTDYLPIDAENCLAFLSARPQHVQNMTDFAFVAKLSEGGRAASFVSWIVPPTDPYRAVMPSTVALDNGELVSALRRRQLDAEVNWVDLYTSPDFGQTWQHRSKVGETGIANGNPPALLRLRDHRLVCCYGDRGTRRMCARLSNDGGVTWGAEITLRDGFHQDTEDDADFGYPRAFQAPDGAVVTVYYWSSPEQPVQHIAATRWNPEDIAG